jgi:hypothetical protein
MRFELTRRPSDSEKLTGETPTLILPDRRRARLSGTFARHLRIQLEFDERTGGYPMTWDTTYSELPTSGWHVLMDFAGKGAVEFDCSELCFEYVPNAA